ncbi:MAG: flagellar biosynthetic protein FliO [Burkholderiales bacterium]|nr:flagellar biosynthetic protein FliO [Burkholderiales bacterium]
MGMNWTALAWFVAILASIPLLLWLFKRSQMLGAHTSSGTARAVAVLPLSASQKLVTVELGRGDDKLWLLLGVTPQNITTLHTMAALPPLPPTVPGAMDDPMPPNGPPSAAFAQLLGRLRGHDGGHHDR